MTRCIARAEWCARGNQIGVQLAHTAAADLSDVITIITFNDVNAGVSMNNSWMKCKKLRS